MIIKFVVKFVIEHYQCGSWNQI